MKIVIEQFGGSIIYVIAGLGLAGMLLEFLKVISG